MLTERLRRFTSAHQRQIWPFFLLVWAGSLSLHFTVRACRSLSPADAAFEVAALGSLCEIAKLSFGPRAVFGFWNAPRAWARVGHLAELALVAALMAGSVGASFAYTTHVEARAVTAAEATRAQAMAESNELEALSKDIDIYDARIEGLLTSARLLREANQLTKAEGKDKRVAEVQAEKNAAVARRAALRGAAPSPVVAASDTTRWMHLALAVAVELIGIAAGVWFHTAQPLEEKEPGERLKSSSAGGKVVPIDATLRIAPARTQPAGRAEVRQRFMECHAEASRLIMSGDIKPTLDALWARFRVSQRPAKRILDALCEEGVIQWNGRRYQRSQIAAASWSGLTDSLRPSC